MENMRKYLISVQNSPSSLALFAVVTYIAAFKLMIKRALRKQMFLPLPQRLLIHKFWIM
jgi:hypothetical protein